jgi:hypothetical protein
VSTYGKPKTDRFRVVKCSVVTRGHRPSVVSNSIRFPFLHIFPSFYFSLPDSSPYFSLSLNLSSLSLSLMAETSSLRFSPFPWVPSISRSREPSSSLPAFTPSPKSSASRPRPSRLLRFAAKASDSGNSFAEESFGFFPWNEGDSGKSFEYLIFALFCFGLVPNNHTAVGWFDPKPWSPPAIRLETQRIFVVVNQVLVMVENSPMAADSAWVWPKMTKQYISALLIFPTSTKLMAYNSWDTEIQWVPEERVTLFTADGLIQIGGSMVPRRVSSSEVCHFYLGNCNTLKNIK